MFQQKIQLSESELLTLIWAKNWTSLLMKFNDTDLDSFSDRASLEAGKWILLPNGKQLLVRLVKQELEIWDGSKELVSGLKSGESDHFSNAWKALISYGILFIIFGISTCTVNEIELKGASSFFAIAGLICIGLAFWAKTKLDKTPLYIALAINGIFCIVLFLSKGWLLIAIMSVLFYYLHKGVSAQPLQKSEAKYNQATNLLDDNI